MQNEVRHLDGHSHSHPLPLGLLGPPASRCTFRTSLQVTNTYGTLAPSSQWAALNS